MHKFNLNIYLQGVRKFVFGHHAAIRKLIIIFTICEIYRSHISRNPSLLVRNTFDSNKVLGNPRPVDSSSIHAGHMEITILLGLLIRDNRETSFSIISCKYK